MIEDIFSKCIGQFGIWQAFILTAIYFEVMFGGFQTFAFLFINFVPSFKCVSENPGKTYQDGRYTSECLKNCSSYDYNTSIFSKTIVSEWDLVCERQWMVSFSQSIYMLGMLTGQPLFGFLSDRYGRRIPLLGAILIILIFSVGVSFAKDYYTFCVLKFITGLGVGGSIIINFVLLVETMGIKYRFIICNIFHAPFIFSEVVLAGIAFLIRRWNEFQLAMSLPYIIIIIVYYFIPESPRWLISKGRSKKAEEVMTSAAKWNKLPSEEIGAAVKKLIEIAAENKSNLEKANFTDLLRTSAMLKLTSVCCAVWFLAGVCYYGMQQYISQLSGDIFMNVCISGLIQMPVPFTIIYAHERFGRKNTALFGAITSAICFVLLSLFPEPPWFRLTLACIGVFSIYTLMATLYVFTCELFPTVVRNMAMGITGTLCRFGGMIAPFIVSVNSGGMWIPPFIFGIMCAAAAFLCLLLTETKGQELRDNLHQSEEPNNVQSTEVTS